MKLSASKRKSMNALSTGKLSGYCALLSKTETRKKDSTMYVVYGLEDPRDGLIHYVGITDDVYKRFSDHIKGSAGNIQKNGWIFECRHANVMIVMRELERVEMLKDALEREKHWIRHYLESGHPLNNMKVAKSILQERARMARLAKRTEKVIRERAVKEKVAMVPRTIWQHNNDSRSESFKEYRKSMLPKALEAWEQGHKTVRTLSKHINISEWHARKLISEINKLHAADRAV